jgi:hypothetical protein
MLFVKKINDNYYRPFPNTHVLFEKKENQGKIDVTIQLDSLYSFEEGDSIYIVNRSNYLEREINELLTVPQDKLYKVNLVDIDNNPLPIADAKDLDIYLNRFKMIPLKDYYIEWNYDLPLLPPQLVIRGVFTEAGRIRLNIYKFAPFIKEYCSYIYTNENNKLNKLLLNNVNENQPLINIGKLSANNKVLTVNENINQISGKLGITSEKINSKFGIEYISKYCLPENISKLLIQLKERFTLDQLVNSTNDSLIENFVTFFNIGLIPISTETYRDYRLEDEGIPERAYLDAGSIISDGLGEDRTYDLNSLINLNSIDQEQVNDYGNNIIIDCRPLASEILTDVEDVIFDCRG